MSWEQHFTLQNIDGFKTYEYTDKEVVALSKNLQQPPGYCVSFRNCKKLIDISSLRSWDASKLTSFNRLFDCCYKLWDITPLSCWNTCNVTNMSYSFNECYRLADITPLQQWNVSGVTNMQRMFYCCSIYNIICISKWIINTDANLTDFATINFHEACEEGFKYAGRWDIKDYNDLRNVLHRYMMTNKHIQTPDLSLVLDVSSLTIPARRSTETQTVTPKGLLSRIFGL